MEASLSRTPCSASALRLSFLALIMLECLTLFAVPSLTAQSTERDRVLISRNGVATFAARATFGAFTGRTSAVSGSVSSNGGPLGAAGWMEVKLDSLRTGNGTRDRHMRDALETGQFPTARFELDSLRLSNSRSDVFAPEGVPVAVRLHGQFRVHGVWREVVSEGTLQQLTPLSWRLTATFPLTLSDYGISKGLSRAFGTIRVEQDISITIEAEFFAG